MEWRDEGIIIGTRRHGETSLILELMTRDHGRHLGLVRGGRSRRMQPLMQPGNAVEVTWRARLDEHLGYYAVEATRLRASEFLDQPSALHGLNVITALLRLLAERERHSGLYEAANTLLDVIGDDAVAPALVVRFEVMILAECGFGIDFDRCAATGVENDLIYVSPKSACAVSRAAGEPYRAKLLPLPPFLREDVQRSVFLAEVVAGFALTGFFLERRIYAPRGLAAPDARAAYISALQAKHAIG